MDRDPEVRDPKPRLKTWQKVSRLRPKTSNTATSQSQAMQDTIYTPYPSPMSFRMAEHWNQNWKTKIASKPGNRGKLISTGVPPQGGSHIDMVYIYVPVFRGTFLRNLVQQLRGGFIRDKGAQIT